MNRNTQTLLPLYKTFVHPILEYSSVIWSPYNIKYDEKIEKVQKKMFRLMKDCKDLSYQSKFKKMNLLSLRARRIQHQLVTMYKIKNGLIDLHFEYFFLKNPFNKTRGNKYK